MRTYRRPTIFSEYNVETSALACGKTATPPPGSHHMSAAYDTFSGHFGPGFGASESLTGTPSGIGFGPGGTSSSYWYYGLCTNWVTLSS